MEKVAVVTGSAKGLGRAMAIALAEAGYTLAVHYRTSNNRARQVLAKIKKQSPKSIIVGADLRKEEEVDEMFAKIFKKLGKVDILINNVGSFLYKELAAITNEEFRDIIETNLFATFFCSRAVLPLMRKAGSGHIINIGAVGADRLNLLKKSGIYFLGKNGVFVLTKNMAHEEAKYGIHVNMISPASLKTDIFKVADFPMGRPATYDDVVKALMFLISDDAYYINGANIEVAGAFISGYV